ncbi:MAG: sulfatase [Planctomycetia bacterium]|nr:sulfatase [Planctomycetia bacterium]
MKTLGCLFLTAMLVSSLAQADTKPNVLFIAVDDLNDWIGCMQGHPQALTPNMDRLAARGVLFTNAHCAAPACNPSRAAIFSGRMPNVTKVWSNESEGIGKLAPDALLLSQAFARGGYLTLGTGKLLHNGGKSAFDEYFNVDQRWSPLTNKGVEYTDKELPSKGTDNPRHVTKDSQGKTVVLPLNRMPSDRHADTKGGESFDWGLFDVPDSDFGDTQITDWAIEQWQRAGDQPLFLGVGYYRPHIPLWAPQRFFERFKSDPGVLPIVKADDLDDLSEAGKQWAIDPITAGSHATVVKHDQWRFAVEAYLACITYVDHEIGRLLDALDKSAAADDTIIVLWSDHGWHLGEKEHWGKWTGWERSTRVPLIVVPPKNQAAKFAVNARCEQPVGLIDLYPTLTEFCAVTPPDVLDGQSLVPLLRKPTHANGDPIVTMFDQGNASLRSGSWRYIRYADGSEELYDHQADPNEWTNLAGIKKYASQKRSLSDTLSQFNTKLETR